MPTEMDRLLAIEALRQALLVAMTISDTMNTGLVEPDGRPDNWTLEDLEATLEECVSLGAKMDWPDLFRIRQWRHVRRMGSEVSHTLNPDMDAPEPRFTWARAAETLPSVLTALNEGLNYLQPQERTDPPRSVDAARRRSRRITTRRINSKDADGRASE